MNQFKFLKTANFQYYLKIYDLVYQSIQKDVSLLESKKDINSITLDESRNLEFYKQSADLLIESTFLQIYAELEASLYHECENQLIKKNASISRFESALTEQGYNTADENWQSLLNICKIRNCLLHGNGRLDIDRYGTDTKNVINLINNDANVLLIEVIDLKEHKEGTAQIRIKYTFIEYCCIKIQNFISNQN